jgi:asparagine synthase (glutamine-hydrolysing)
MCGIAGVFSRERAAVARIQAMTAALRHRGPDDEGYLLADPLSGQAEPYAGDDTMEEIRHPRLPAEPPSGYTLALGHRRLAIIDVGAGGHGPMSSADGRHWITYNGEVYNYVELREELRAHGHAFRTCSDTEVLLAAYAQWGPEALHRFNGMFAFALYDAPRRRLFCARDRFGVKPFYYHHRPPFFACASEIKGLLAHHQVPCAPHLPYVAGFLAKGALDETDATFFTGIRALPAAHYLTLDLVDGRLELQRWYELPARGETPLAADALRSLLEDAVRLRLRSDVDVGTCLSGGLDSSSIVCLAARLRDHRQPGRHRTFSILYDDAGLEEAPYVRAAAEAAAVENSSVKATSADLLRDLPSLVRHQDEPIPSTGPYSHWRVMELARAAGLKVLLDGQGADELLAGYHYHFGPFLNETLARRGPLAALREARHARAVTGRPLSFFLGLLAHHALPLPDAVREHAIGRFSTHTHVPEGWLDPALLERVGAPSGSRHRPRATLAEERRANVWSTSLPALLRYEDRNSMAFGIEARTPYLDYRLVEAVIGAPAGDLIRDGWTKALLREAMRGVLPEQVRLRRDKLGFSTPERRFLAELAPHVREWLAPGSRAAELLRPAGLRKWLALPDAELAQRPGLWRVVCLEHWLRYVASVRAPAA